MSCIVLDVYRMLAGKGETWPISGVQFADGRACCDAIVGESVASGFHVTALSVLCVRVAPHDSSKETLSQERIIYGISET